MSEHPIDLLSDRISFFLSNRLGWSKLNPIQEKAIPVILENKDTLVLAPTASGKTEAVLIPVFNEILSKGIKPVSVLYISPLKALINDIHTRIESWGNHFSLTATKWHGDVTKNDKDKFIKNPTNFLSTTPESLEVILMNRKEGEKNRIFNNIKYIIIDEIHYFADSDRGVQLNSILNRMKEYLPNDVVTVGLSATVGNPDKIASWINPKEPATIVMDESRRKFQYKILNIDEYNVADELLTYKDKKVLVFVNSRAAAELVFSNLKKQYNEKNVFIHHGSINKTTREENERKFKEAPSGFMVSTSTLELGIDIGNIDLIFHVKSAHTVSGFLQRMGRSGRRKGIQRSVIAANNIDIFKSLAEVILSHEDQIEDISISKKSVDIFFHQILSSLFAKGKCKIAELYNELTGCYAFSEISFDEYMELLEHMQELDFIDYYKPYLSLGYEFEKEFGNRNFLEFFSVFMPSYEYLVKQGRQEIGGLDVSFATFLAPADNFTLAGKLWKVKSINHDRYTIQAEIVKNVKTAIPKWDSGTGAPLNYLISRKIYDILLGDFDKKFLKPLDKDANEFIELGRLFAQESGFSEGIIPVEKTDKGEYFIYTFAGDKANKLLATIFEMYYDLSNIKINPFYCSFKADEITNGDIESIIYDVKNILKEPDTIHKLDELTANFKKNKFIKYLTPNGRADVKNRILFDERGLIDVIENNSLYFMTSECFFRTRILGSNDFN